MLSSEVLRSHSPRARLLTINADGSTRVQYDPDRIILSGEVTHDRRREVRRTGSFTLVDRDGSLSPASFGDAFAQGETVRVERGARISGVDVFALLGIFEVTSFDSGGGRLSVMVEDPSTALQQDMGEVLIIPPYTSAAGMVRLLWEPVLGDSTGWDLDSAGMASTEPVIVAEDEQRLHAAIGRMFDFGLELYVSRSGDPYMRAYVDPATVTPTRTYTTGAGVALATSVHRVGDRLPVNRMVVIGEPPNGAVIRAVADVTDMLSPIHADRIGLRVAPIYRSAAITTQYQAETVARARLIEATMWADTLMWVGMPDPTVEPGEVITVVDAHTRTNASYRVESVSCPIAMGAMSIEASLVTRVFA